MKLNKILIPAFVLFILIAFPGKIYSQDGSQSNVNQESVYDKDGYDQYGFNKEGYDREGYSKEGYNKDGIDRKGNLKGSNSTTDPNSGNTEVKSDTPPGADKDKSTEVAPEQKGHEIDKNKKSDNSSDSKDKKKKKNKRKKNKSN